MLRKVWLALSNASRFGRRPRLWNATTADLDLARSAPPGPGLTEVTGIYQDGKGTYLPGDSVEFFQSDLRITPLCSASRSLNVLLPAAALVRLTGPMETCRGRGGLLKIPALLNARTGVMGEPSLPPDYPMGASVFYYFVVDSNGDGRFSLDDDAYTLVWQSGIHLTRSEHSDRTVYELTTELTSPDAELIRETDAGGVSEGVFPMPLRLTATRSK
jgi:hypothetical protein